VEARRNELGGGEAVSEVRATVREVNDQIVLDDPDALATANAVAKHNCRLTLDGQVDRVAHFKQRVRCLQPDDVVIVLLNVDGQIGRQLTEILMPGQDAMWQSLRDSGQVPFARGLAKRTGMQEFLDAVDRDAGDKLRAMADTVAVVVADHGVVEVFEA
jgi:hypothetical protein